MNYIQNPGDITKEDNSTSLKKENHKENISFFRWLKRSFWAKLFLFLIIIAPSAYIIAITITLSRQQAVKFDFIRGKIPGSDASLYSKLSDAQSRDLQKAQDMEMELAFLKNKMALSALDSVYISLDIPDSQIILEIKGVPVLKSKIYKIFMTKKFDKISHNQTMVWLSSPFTLQKKDATIPKLPMVFKKAPKDTTEAKLASDIPVATDTGAVYYNLQFNRGLILDVEQVEEPGPENAKVINDYLAEKKKKAAIEALRLALKFEAPEQYMHIKILIKQEDAKAIYRAIPREAELALKLWSLQI